MYGAYLESKWELKKAGSILYLFSVLSMNICERMIELFLLDFIQRKLVKVLFQKFHLIHC